MLFLKNDSYIYCTTIKVETPYSGKRKRPPENQTGGWLIMNAGRSLMIPGCVYRLAVPMPLESAITHST